VRVRVAVVDKKSAVHKESPIRRHRLALTGGACVGRGYVREFEGGAGGAAQDLDLKQKDTSKLLVISFWIPNVPSILIERNSERKVGSVEREGKMFHPKHNDDLRDTLQNER